jgi:hypothetical protein
MTRTASIEKTPNTQKMTSNAASAAASRHRNATTISLSFVAGEPVGKDNVAGYLFHGAHRLDSCRKPISRNEFVNAFTMIPLRLPLQGRRASH